MPERCASPKSSRQAGGFKNSTSVTFWCVARVTRAHRASGESAQEALGAYMKASRPCFLEGKVRHSYYWTSTRTDASAKPGSARARASSRNKSGELFPRASIGREAFI